MEKKLTVKEVTEKYADIESKIPSVWKSYEEAEAAMQKDLSETWETDGDGVNRVASMICRNGKFGAK